MLFIKDMLFLDGAMAIMAPDIDVWARSCTIVTYFHEHHGERIAREIGLAAGTIPADRPRRHPGVVRRHRARRRTSPTTSSRNAASSSESASSSISTDAAAGGAEADVGSRRTRRPGGAPRTPDLTARPSCPWATSCSTACFPTGSRARRSSPAWDAWAATWAVGLEHRLVGDRLGGGGRPRHDGRDRHRVAALHAADRRSHRRRRSSPEPTVKVPEVPSALFTVSDHVLVAACWKRPTRCRLRLGDGLVAVRALDGVLPVDDPGPAMPPKGPPQPPSAPPKAAPPGPPNPPVAAPAPWRWGWWRGSWTVRPRASPRRRWRSASEGVVPPEVAAPARAAAPTATPAAAAIPIAILRHRPEDGRAGGPRRNPGGRVPGGGRRGVGPRPAVGPARWRAGRARAGSGWARPASSAACRSWRGASPGRRWCFEPEARRPPTCGQPVSLCDNTEGRGGERAAPSGHAVECGPQFGHEVGHARRALRPRAGGARGPTPPRPRRRGAQASAACSGVDTPMPMHTGRSVTPRSLRATSRADAASSAAPRSRPCAPRRRRTPGSARRCARARSSGVDGATSNTVATPAASASAHHGPASSSARSGMMAPATPASARSWAKRRWPARKTRL